MSAAHGHGLDDTCPQCEALTKLSHKIATGMMQATINAMRASVAGTENLTADERQEVLAVTACMVIDGITEALGRSVRDYQRVQLIQAVMKNLGATVELQVVHAGAQKH